MSPCITVNFLSYHFHVVLQFNVVHAYSAGILTKSLLAVSWERWLQWLMRLHASHWQSHLYISFSLSGVKCRGYLQKALWFWLRWETVFLESRLLLSRLKWKVFPAGHSLSLNLRLNAKQRNNCSSLLLLKEISFSDMIFCVGWRCILDPFFNK